jgi:acetolactate synthase-1/2/3 large subunit
VTREQRTRVRVADYVMARLAEAGAKQVFLLPGGGAMHLNDALACEKRLEAIPCHHEQACGIAAEANGRVEGPPFGVALVTTGPGATNVITPVAGAWIDSLPLMIVSGQVKRADRLGGRPIRQGGVQEVDVVPMVASITKYAVVVDSPDEIGAHLDRAIHEMLNGRKGPVWIDIPLDVQAATIIPATLERWAPRRNTTNKTGPRLTKQVDALRAHMKEAERPLILAGHGVRVAGAAEEFRKFAEGTGTPVVTTWNALDLLPWEHPLLVGRPGSVALRAPNFAVQNCDLLIAIGARLDNVVTAHDPKAFARRAKKYVIDVDPNELERHDGMGATTINFDALSFLAEWNFKSRRASRQNREHEEWRKQCADWKYRYGIGDGQPMSTKGEITHYTFVDALSDALDEDRLVISGSSGLAVEVLYTVFRNKSGQRMFLTSGLGAMGYGLAAAIGACLGAGRKPTVCVEGDGSLQLNIQELNTLKQLNLPIVIIVMNNRGYASIRNTQRNYFQSRFIATGPEANLGLPDLVALSKALGIPAMRIEKAEDLAEGLAKSAAQKGPFICDVLLSANEVLAPKVAAVPQADGSMLSMPLEDMSPLLPLEELEREMGGKADPRSVKAREKRPK